VLVVRLCCPRLPVDHDSGTFVHFLGISDGQMQIPIPFKSQRIMFELLKMIRCVLKGIDSSTTRRVDLDESDLIVVVVAV